MEIVKLLKYARLESLKQGEFPSKPKKDCYSIIQWLDKGYKVTDFAIQNGGAYYTKITSTNNIVYGKKYYLKSEVEPMTNNEKIFYKNFSNKSGRFERVEPIQESGQKERREHVQSILQKRNRVMGRGKECVSYTKSGDAFIKNLPSYDIRTLSNKMVAFLNIETTGEKGKGSPKYNDEILSISIIALDLNTNAIVSKYKHNYNATQKKSWKNAELAHGLRPVDVQALSSFDTDKENVQRYLNQFDVVVSYGDENFKFLEECGVNIPRERQFDTKEMFAKQHPEVGDFSMSKYIKVYESDNCVKHWEKNKHSEQAKGAEYKNYLNAMITAKQYRNTLQKLEEESYER